MRREAWTSWAFPQCLLCYTVPTENHPPLSGVSESIWFRHFYYCCTLFCMRGKLSHYSVWLRAGRPDDTGSIPGRNDRILPLAFVSRPTLGPTQPSVQWVPGVLSPGVKRGRGVTLTTHPHLLPRSRMSRIYTSSPPKRHQGV
jgi:hypothetical protein